MRSCNYRKTERERKGHVTKVKIFLYEQKAPNGTIQANKNLRDVMQKKAQKSKRRAKAS